MELETVLELSLHETLTDLGTEHALEWHLLHSHHRDVGSLRKSDSSLHTDEARSDDNDVLALLGLISLLVTNSLVDGLGVADLPEDEHVGKSAPSMGIRLGIPPVARTSFSYSILDPLLSVTDLALESTPVTVPFSI